MHKYETGENRMPSQRIKMCAEIFNIPISNFYGEENTDVEKVRLLLEWAELIQANLGNFIGALDCFHTEKFFEGKPPPSDFLTTASRG